MPMTDRRRRITAFVVAMAVLIATPLVVVATDAFTDVPASNVHHTTSPGYATLLSTQGAGSGTFGN